MEFIRFAGTINTHEEKKVAKATVNVVLEECTGTFYITDIMFQEGKLQITLKRNASSATAERLFHF